MNNAHYTRLCYTLVGLTQSALCWGVLEGRKRLQNLSFLVVVAGFAGNHHQK